MKHMRSYLYLNSCKEAKELLRPGHGHVYKLATEVGGLWNFLNGEYENDRDDIDEGEDHYSSDDQDDLDIVDFHNEGDHEETPTNTEEVLDDPKSDFIDPEYKVKK
ncbi:hypothetical protein Tco_0979183 [Tanacetum coccineum]